MSGHSKFANIKHKKEKNDAAKGKVFTKIGREIAVAVKEGGGADPANNSRLRDAIAKAKANNMPNDNIDRSIKKAAGDGDANNYEHIVYEGYGPNGTAIIVDALTDNRNRTASNVRSAFTKGKGNIGTSGCVSFMFDQKGQIIVDKEECELDADDLMMQALDAGADDYITKPFSVEELLARIRVTQRRLAVMQSGEQIESSVFENGGLKIDYTAGCTYLKGEELHLTPIEYKLLCLLSRNVGKVLTHTYITQQIWGRCSDNDVASLRVFMATLRKKLEPEKNGVQYIQTHIGIGYRMLRIEK